MKTSLEKTVSIMRSPFSLVALGAFLSLTHALDLPGITLPWRKYQAEVFADDEKVRSLRIRKMT